MDIANMISFILASLVLNLTPGPDMMFVGATALAHGRRAGIWAALGIGFGTCGHILLAVAGTAALVAAFPSLLAALQGLGALYLIWLGVQMLRTTPGPSAKPQTDNPKQLLLRGAVTNLLNPKVGLFFLAFLPQFVDPAAGPVPIQMLMLGLIFNLSGTSINALAGIMVAGAAARGKDLLGSNRGAQVWSSRIAGTIMIGLGLRIALTAQSRL